MEDSKNLVPYRQMTVYQSDDGRKIEVFSKKGTIQYQERDNVKKPEFDLNLVDIYVGVAQIITEYGIKEVRFHIEADNLEDAFNKHYKEAMLAHEEVQRQIEEHKKKQMESIVTASEEDLKRMDSGLIIEE